VAVFHSDSLGYIDHHCVAQASWAALDESDLLYVGAVAGQYAVLYRYSVDWNALDNQEQLSLSDETQIILRDGNGNPLPLSHMQGGVFSVSGDLLYMVTGMVGEDPDIHGIHVFDTGSWHRVQHSTNGTGHFNYEFDPSEGSSDEEPEGITIWDLDGGQAPYIRGQLHVLLVDNGVTADDVFLKHYTGTIYVDATYSGDECGTPSQPFNTVGEAYGLAWNGAEISIAANSYPENLTLSKRIRLTARGGTVRIGQ